MAGPLNPMLSESTVWSSRVLEYLDKSYVYVSALTNRNYEGEAKVGGTVKMFYISDVSVSDYTGGWVDSDWAALSDNAKTLQIDQAKKLLIKVPDVNEQFSVLNLIDQGAQRMAVAIGDVIDQFVAAKNSAVVVANQYGNDTTPIVVGNGSGEVKPTQAIARLRQSLVDAKAPITGPRAVVPTWFATMLQGELGAHFSALGDAALRGEFAVKPGYLANIGGIDLFVSPNVPNTTGAKYKVLAGDPMITFASAIEQVETMRLQNDFATGVKSLYVYGALLPRGEYMSLGTFNIGTY